MKIFSTFPTIIISKRHYWLVICIAKNLIWTTLKMIFSIFRFFCTLRFQIYKYCPNHTSMESYLFSFQLFENWTYDWFCAPGSHTVPPQQVKRRWWKAKVSFVLMCSRGSLRAHHTSVSPSVSLCGRCFSCCGRMPLTWGRDSSSCVLRCVSVSVQRCWSGGVLRACHSFSRNFYHYYCSDCVYIYKLTNARHL